MPKTALKVSVKVKRKAKGIVKVKGKAAKPTSGKVAARRAAASAAAAAAVDDDAASLDDDADSDA
jgi:hypothetical protein